jgi:hypothetical protein
MRIIPDYECILLIAQGIHRIAGRSLNRLETNCQPGDYNCGDATSNKNERVDVDAVLKPLKPAVDYNPGRNSSW